MTRTTLIALGLLALLGAQTSVATERAIWTWEQASYAMLEDRAAADAAIAFLRSKHIRTVYLYADAYQERNLLEARPELYRQLNRRLHARGLRAFALLGSAHLHTEAYVLPEHRNEALAMFRRVLDYNAAARPDERFDGINLDIEPHVLDQWAEQKLQLLGQFLDLGQALMELKRASGQALAVGPAIPFWLDGIMLDWQGMTRPASELVIDIYDYVALMDYRDHAEGPDGIVSLGADEMEYANRRHKKVVIGVDFTPGEIQKTSFDHLIEADLERELALTERAFHGSRVFAGFALHHFGAYQRWLERDPHTASAGAAVTVP
ncbi:MAG TPA: hypothetical protein VK130_07310 [Steroidobacteraceae bacterium]|nr:hypothetical protein [Steroidobacteraceae bacterium]